MKLPSSFKNMVVGSGRYTLPLFVVLAILTSCGGRRVDEPENTVKNMQCTPMSKTKTEDEIVYFGKGAQKRSSFTDLRSEFSSSCAGCHLSPAAKAGFSYLDSFFGEQKTIDGVNAFIPGFNEMAERSLAAMRHGDPAKKMPPEKNRATNPAFYDRLANKLQVWIAAGKPQGGFDLSTTPAETNPNLYPRQRRNEMGECIPKAEAIGFDFIKDRQFAAMTRLPADLADTDIFTFDSFELAKKGTVSYNVAYPLWADNSDKGRWVHFPMGIEGGRVKRLAAKYRPNGAGFDIPENTRFYKNFYKKITMANGRTRYKRMETRIIVVRYPAKNSLFGTYKWDDLEQSATLIETPRRDGTPFKDTKFEVVVDERKSKTREYAIPGSARCIDCHSGSESGNFVLGFSPLQLNHRLMGEGGRQKETNPEELSQISRLIEYGFVENAPAVADFPKLELLGNGTAPRNIFELNAQAYMVGNCAHCHNPAGLAFQGSDPMTLDLTAGKIFGFSTYTQNKGQNRRIVDATGDLMSSHIYRKVADTQAELGITRKMPMNTPGAPDCEVLRVIGKWVRSYESLAAAEAWEPDCFITKKEMPLNWINQDFTRAPGGVYIPRRTDWKSATGMPDKFKSLVISPALQAAAKKMISVGWYSDKPDCKFPEVNKVPEDQWREWMDSDLENHPYGHVYATTPGSWYFRTSCVKCHGPKADGVSEYASGISIWSGGDVEVADLINGMFGKNDKQEPNMKEFQIGEENFGAQYLIWMAMEGTKVQFPKEGPIAAIVGKHGGQMLNSMRDKCVTHIDPNRLAESYEIDFEIFREICFVDNLNPDHPSLQWKDDGTGPVDEAAVKAWADRAAYNVGFAIYEYLKEASEGNWRPGNDQCEVVYPKSGAAHAR